MKKFEEILNKTKRKKRKRKNKRKKMKVVNGII